MIRLPEKMMQKIDIKKTHKLLYTAPKGEFVAIDVPALDYLMIDGHGDPNCASEYKDAVETLYAVSYTLKFMSKDEVKQDYVVPPLEGLWWSENMADFVARRKEAWSWTMMIVVPDIVKRSMAERAIEAAAEKKKPAALSKLRIERLAEGRAIQTLHVGSYDDEGPILARLHDEFLPANGLVPTGHHHEIYLSDPRKTSSDRLRTILRQPVRLAG